MRDHFRHDREIDFITVFSRRYFLMLFVKNLTYVKDNLVYKKI